MRICLSIIILFAITATNAQTKYIGKVLDHETNLPLVGVTIRIDSVETQSNSKGFFQIIADSSRRISISFDGYESNVYKLPQKERFSVLIKRIATERDKDLVDSFYKYFLRNIKYPSTARENRKQGLTLVYFETDATGKIVSYKVVKEVGFQCSDEVIRVLKKSPPIWYDVKRHTKFALPVIFKIEGEPSPQQEAVPIADGYIKISEIIVTASRVP